MRGQLLFLPCCINNSVWADCTGGDANVYPDFDMGTHYFSRDVHIGSVIGKANARAAFTLTYK
jgi:hypothetical protein